MLPCKRTKYMDKSYIQGAKEVRHKNMIAFLQKFKNRLFCGISSYSVKLKYKTEITVVVTSREVGGVVMRRSSWAAGNELFLAQCGNYISVLIFLFFFIAVKCTEHKIYHFNHC